VSEDKKDAEIKLDTMYSGPAWVRVLSHDSGKLALFIEFAQDEEGNVVADLPDDPEPKVSSIILPTPIIPDEYAPAAVSVEEAVLTV
jgi:hypothetical protein